MVRTAKRKQTSNQPSRSKAAGSTPASNKKSRTANGTKQKTPPLDIGSDDDTDEEEELFAYEKPVAPARLQIVNNETETAVANIHSKILLTEEIKQAMLPQNSRAAIDVDVCLEYIIKMKVKMENMTKSIQDLENKAKTNKKQENAVERQQKLFQMMMKVIEVLFHRWKFVGAKVFAAAKLSFTSCTVINALY